MTPVTFPQANIVMNPPPDVREDVIAPVPAYHSMVEGGPLDGAKVYVVAWKISESDLQKINDGAYIYLTMLDHVVPHILTTEFPN